MVVAGTCPATVEPPLALQMIPQKIYPRAVGPDRQPNPPGPDTQEHASPLEHAGPFRQPNPQGPTTTYGGSSGSGDPMPNNAPLPANRPPAAKLAPKLPPPQPRKLINKPFQARLRTVEEHDGKAEEEGRENAIARGIARATKDIAQAQTRAKHGVPQRLHLLSTLTMQARMSTTKKKMPWMTKIVPSMVSLSGPSIPSLTHGLRETDFGSCVALVTGGGSTMKAGEITIGATRGLCWHLTPRRLHHLSSQQLSYQPSMRRSRTPVRPT